MAKENKKKLNLNYLNRSLASVLVDTYFSDVKPLADWYRKQLDIRNIVLDHNLSSKEARNSEKYVNGLGGVLILQEDLKGMNKWGDLYNFLDTWKCRGLHEHKINTMSLRMKNNILKTYVMIDSYIDDEHLVEKEGRRKIKIFSFDEFMNTIKKGLKTKNELYFEESAHGRIAFGINGFVGEDQLIPIYGLYQISRNLKAEFYIPNIGEAARKVVNKDKIKRRIRITYNTKIENFINEKIIIGDPIEHAVYSYTEMTKEEEKVHKLLEDMKKKFLNNYITDVNKEITNIIPIERIRIKGDYFEEKAKSHK